MSTSCANGFSMIRSGWNCTLSKPSCGVIGAWQARRCCTLRLAPDVSRVANRGRLIAKFGQLAQHASYGSSLPAWTAWNGIKIMLLLIHMVAQLVLRFLTHMRLSGFHQADLLESIYGDSANSFVTSKLSKAQLCCALHCASSAFIHDG